MSQVKPKIDIMMVLLKTRKLKKSNFVGSLSLCDCYAMFLAEKFASLSQPVRIEVFPRLASAAYISFSF